MKRNNFDVLIVYSELLASSATTSAERPFGTLTEDHLYNRAYKYFLEQCHNQKLSAALTTSADISGAGTCSSYWVIENGSWVKHQENASSKFVFDKFSPRNSKLSKTRKLLFSSDKIHSINDSAINQLFFDKQKSYEKFKAVSIPSVVVKEHSIQGIKDALSSLQKLVKIHPNKLDFSSKIILKDRFGLGGDDIYKFDITQTKEIYSVLKNAKKDSFILQPFTLFNSGYEFEGKPVAADIRLIFLNKKIIQTYIRMAKKGGFLCNEHQGGSLKYIKLSDVPEIVLKKAKAAFSLIGKNSSLFSLDFIVGNSGSAFLIEGNTRPGLDWNPDIKLNVMKSKELINDIVIDLKKRITTPKVIHSSDILQS